MRIAETAHKEEIKTGNSGNYLRANVLRAANLTARNKLQFCGVEDCSALGSEITHGDPAPATRSSGLCQTVGFRERCRHGVHGYSTNKLLEIRRFGDRALGNDPDAVLNIA